MTARPRLTLLLAVAGALLLLAAQFGLASSGAGPYISLAPVRLGLSLGAGLAYLVALWLAMTLSARAEAIQSSTRRRWMLAILAVAGGVFTFIAPLLPSAVLSLTCLSRSLCPDSANPILWGYLQLMTELPILPFAVGFALVLLSAILARRPWRDT